MTYIALAILLLIGLWLRLRFINTISLYPDEFVTLLAVQMIGEKGTPTLPSGLFYEHGIFFSYLGSLAAPWGDPQVMVRYTSLFFSLLTLGLLFWLGRRWFSPAVGLIAMAGLTIAPTAIQWGGRARMYALLQLLVLLTLWLAYEGVTRNIARWRWLAMLTYLATLLTHFVSITLAPPLFVTALLLGWMQHRDKLSSLKSLVSPLKSTKFYLELLAFVLVVATGFLIKRAGQPKGIDTLDTSESLTGIAQVFAIYSDFSFDFIKGWQAVNPFFFNRPAPIYLPFLLITIIATFYMFIRWLSKQPTSHNQSLITNNQYSNLLSLHLPSLYLSLILVLTTLEMVLFVSPDRRDDKYLFMLLPVLLLLGAQGMVLVGRQLFIAVSSWLDQRGQSSRSNWMSPVTWLMPLIVVAIVIFWTRPAVDTLLNDTGDDYAGAFAYVQDQWQAGDKVMTGTPTAAAFYFGFNDFYSVQRPGKFDYRILTVNDQLAERWLGSPAVRTNSALTKTFQENTVWIILERWGLQFDYYELPFQQQLLAQTDYVRETQGMFILRSKPNPQPLIMNPTHPVEVTWTDQIKLLGYTLEPDPPAPGQPLRLTLYWQAIAPMQADYTIFVHVREPGGGNVAQADHRPLGSIYPTTLWPVGETIRESSDLFLPTELPAGDYELWVGLYLLETGERLAVQNDTSGENAVNLGRIKVHQP